MRKGRLFKSQFSSALRQEKALLSSVIFALLFQAALSMVQPWPLQIIFDNVILGKPPGKLLVRISGSFWPTISKNLLTISIVVLLAVALLNGLALYVQNIRSTRLIQKVVHRLRVSLFSHVMELPVAYFNKVGAGEIVSRITTDTADTKPLLEGGIILVCRSIPTFVGIFLIMMSMDLPFALLTLALAPFLAWSTYFFGQRVKRASRMQRRHESQLADVTALAVRTQRCLKLLGLQDQEVQRLADRCLQSRRAAVEAGSWQGFYTAATTVALTAGTALMVLVGVFRIKAGYISPGELLVFMNYLRSLFKPVREVTKYFNKISKAMACNERIEEVMAIAPCHLGVCEIPNAIPMPPFREEIEFKDVSFQYDAENRIFEGMSFRIQKGQKVAVVGDSGSGKSTLLSLIPRFFDTNGGQILIDGRDIRSFSLDSLRRQIAIVPQEHIIFHTTVMENIALGRPEQKARREEIYKAAEKANAHEFISQLPDGYQTELGTGHVQLSGGQAKRLLIARALLRNAPIVLLDEPTSGLDPHSETQVMEAFDNLMEQRTILIVTHDLPTIANAGLIIVLREGRIVESGSHEELLEKEGLYDFFWKEQVGRILPADIPR